MIVFKVDLDDELARFADLLGNPRDFPSIEESTLQKGDFAALAVEEGNFGVVYFLRGKQDENFEYLGGQTVLGVKTLLLQTATYGHGKGFIEYIAKHRGFQVKVRRSKDMDGIFDLFYVFT